MLRIETFLFLFLLTETKCVCRHSYTTFCDDLEDIAEHDVRRWKDLVVGSDDLAKTRLRPINFTSLQLDKLEKLESLVILGQISEIKSYTFAIEPEETRLRHVKLYGNDIPRLRYASFDSMILVKLSLQNNKIGYIHEGAFYNCEFRSVDLSHNELEAVENGVFVEGFLINTTEIDLSYNRLESVAPKSFPSSLEVLNLDHNQLQFLPFELFDGTSSLLEFTLSHNKLTTVPHVVDLKLLRVLDVSNNKILEARINQFNNLSDMEVLDLSNNNIANAAAFDCFRFPKRHPSLQISLAFNRLTHLVIGNDSFRDHIVFFYGNPWNCKCWEALEQFMKVNLVKRNACDLQFFGNGQTPYCVNYSGNNCTGNGLFVKNPEFGEKELKEFLELISLTKKTVHCDISPRRL